MEHPWPTTRVISVGETARYYCSAAGFPIGDIVWTRDGGTVEDVGIEILSSTDPPVARSFLNITSATVNLTGMYRCRIVTTIEGFPPDVVESNPATIIVQGMQYTHLTIFHRM